MSRAGICRRFRRLLSQSLLGAIVVASNALVFSASAGGSDGVRREISITGNAAFGDVFLGLSGSAAFTIYNDGNAPLSVTNIVYPPGFVGPWTGTVPAGGQQAVTVYFSPGAASSYSGSIAVESDATAGVASLPISGNGVVAFGDNGWHLEPLGAFWALADDPQVVGGAEVFGPSIGIATAPDGTICLTDPNEAVVKVISPMGAVSVLAGKVGVGGNADGSAADARFGGLGAPAFSPSGDLYVIDGTKIREISANGIVSTLPIPALSYVQVGVLNDGSLVESDWSGGVRHLLPDGSFQQLWPASVRTFGPIFNIAVDRDGSVLAAYTPGEVIWRLRTNGNNEVFTGASGRVGYQDGPLATALFRDSAGMSVDNSGNVFIADTHNNAIRMVSSADMTVSTVIGNPTQFPAPGIFGTNGVVLAPQWVTPDPDGNLVVVDQSLHRVIRRDAPKRTLRVAGDGNFGTVGVGETVLADVVLSNSGDAPIRVDRIRVPAGFSASWSGILAPGDLQHVPLSFHPLTAGNYAGGILVECNGNSGTNVLRLSASAIGSASRILQMPGSLTFPDTLAGDAKHSTITISNIGNATLHVTGVSLPAGFYGAWTGSIIPGGSQLIDVAFKPTATANYSGTLTVNSDATSGVAIVPIQGNGIGVVGPKVTQQFDKPAGRLVISWPGNATGYAVEGATSLVLGDWTPLTNAVAVTNGQFSVSVGTAKPQEFFRVRKP